ncbi:MAG: hypothetical protein ACR2LN_08245 [Candidatus Levyibacteriota bacterium]
MKIIICCSITAADEVLRVRDALEKMGYSVEIPEGVKNKFLRVRTEISVSEKASDKIQHDLIKKYYEKIKLHDAILVVNPEKRGIKGYIGGNTLMEMGFGYVLNKKLYVLYPLPDIQYRPELEAMQPIILNGELNKIVTTS